MTPARRWYSQGRKILAWSALRKQEAISFGQRGTETTDVEVGPLRLVGIGGVISALAVESSTKPPPIGARQTKANFSPGQATRRKLFLLDFWEMLMDKWVYENGQRACQVGRPWAEACRLARAPEATRRLRRSGRLGHCKRLGSRTHLTHPA